MSANVETSGFVGRVLGDRWVVGEQLGSGTFGVVHAGIERGTGQAVALKLLHPQFLHHGETIARFWNEAEALRRLDHPNVLVLLDVGVADDGIPYLVTELLTGETLRDLLNREGALPPERAMRLLGPAAHALHHAHMAGIVHRDLKPENIFRVRRDGMGTTKILDFGMAKLLDTGAGRKLSQTGVMIGTMAYSPPEQMQGISDIDHRADQFGFAALIFESLTGQRPFPQAQPFALFQAVMSGPRPMASSVCPTLPPAVDRVLARALDPDRTRRFDNVEQFYLAVSGALTGQSLSETFHGVRPAAPAPPPAAPVLPPPRELSPRFQAVEDELTRGDLHTTLATGGNKANFGSTLAEGRSVPPMASPPLPPVAPSYTPPPSSLERPIHSRPESVPMPAVASVPPPPQSAAAPNVAPAPAPAPVEAEPPAKSGSGSMMWLVVIALVVITLAGLAVLVLHR
ncbi:MAG: serine/threonine protein kinase [Polyangiales bacterium]